MAGEGSSNVSMQALITGEKNPRGIPATIFIEDVEEFLGENSVETMLGAFNELYSKYKYMETTYERSKGAYKTKIPEITQTLEIIRSLIARRDNGESVTTNYGLADTLYTTAKIDTAEDVVYLWIGANTMVEYSYDDAVELLETQLTQTISKVAELQEDLHFLRGNSITVEVNMARLFNHSVKLKKAKEALANATPEEATN